MMKQQDSSVSAALSRHQCVKTLRNNMKEANGSTVQHINTSSYKKRLTIIFYYNT